MFGGKNFWLEKRMDNITPHKTIAVGNVTTSNYATIIVIANDAHL